MTGLLFQIALSSLNARRVTGENISAIIRRKSVTTAESMRLIVGSRPDAGMTIRRYFF